MIFSITEMIATISAGITLQAGDILATGTPAGECLDMGEFDC
jgi:2-keto-4-pentenoate hydratase/2-oxohepta-3-ene-1,7-dioic acid hydratase in catechol pathway